MAAPSYFVAATGATDAGGAWTYNGGGQTGLVTIIQILQDGATSGAVTTSTFANVENLAGTDNAMDYIGAFPVGSPTAAFQHFWIGRNLNNTGATITGGNSTSEDLYCRGYTFTNVSTGTTLATVIENSTAGSTANTAATDGTITDAGVTTLGPDRLALNFVAINDDNVIPIFTGQTGGPWASTITHYAESSGTDGSIAIQWAPVCSPGVYAESGVQDGIFGGSGTNEQLAQSFASPGTCTITQVALQWDKTLSPTDNFLVEIQTDNAGAPSGTVVGTGGSLAMSGNPDWASFAVNASISASTTYWLVARRSGSRDTSNYGEWERSSSAYASGTAAIRSSGSWTNQAYDYNFGIATTLGGTINGGTAINSDSGDGWGAVGFALIGTTVTEVTYVPRHPAHDHGSVTIF